VINFAWCSFNDVPLCTSRAARVQRRLQHNAAAGALFLTSHRTEDISFSFESNIRRPAALLASNPYFVFSVDREKAKEKAQMEIM
jgi:hypothetical protein